jgi:S1-C subfamily serine protease
MEPDAGPPNPLEPAGVKLIAKPAVKLRIALASACLLTVGALLAPRPRSTTATLAPPEERPAPLLDAQVQRQVSERQFRGVQEAGERVASFGVAIPGVGRPEPRSMPDVTPGPLAADLPGFGVIVSPDGDVLTHAAALEGRSSLTVVSASGTMVGATLAAYEPETGLALLRLTGGTRYVPAPRDGTPLSAGALLVATGRANGRNVVMPLFLMLLDPDNRWMFGGAGPVPAGMPVYDLDGNLRAITAGSPAMGAIPIGDAVERLRARASEDRGLAASLGLSLQAIDDSLREIVGPDGALVSDVVEGGPAHDAGLEPGDVLLEIGERTVGSQHDALRGVAALRPDEVVRVVVRREAERLEMSVRAASAFDLAALDPRQPPAGPTVQALAEARLRIDSLPPGARIISVNRRRVASPAEALREIRRATGPSLLYLDEVGERFFVALEPSR